MCEVIDKVTKSGGLGFARKKRLFFSAYAISGLQRKPSPCKTRVLMHSVPGSERGLWAGAARLVVSQPASPAISSQWTCRNVS